MANLKDIAQKLGVSVSTVSRGLNGGKEISREMTEKILKAADELGYTLQGRGGRATPDWNSAGIIVPEVASEYYARLVQKAKDFLAAKGYSLIMKLTDFKAAELLDAINTMSRIHVKCLLVVMDTEENMSDQLISAMHRSGLPIMLITSKYYPLLEFDCIHLDEYSGIIMGVQHLQKRGYQRIACISDRISLSRVTVFKQAMKLQGMKVDPQLICVGPERAESGGYLRTKELLSLENPPDAVFCCYDQMAIGAIHALRESGLRIPEDMAVMGFDNLTSSKYIEGGITTIANPYEDMLSVAVNILTKRTKNPQMSQQQIALRPNLVVRHTT